MTTKVCSSCGIEKPIDQFWKRRDSRDGHRGECRTCLDEYFRVNRAEHLERRRWSERRCYYKHRAVYNQVNQEHKKKVRAEVLTYYSGGACICVRCGFDDVRALSIDHIEGGGKQHERDRKGTGLSQWLKARGFPKGYQTLCMNCQFIKKLENKEQTKSKLI